MFHRCLTLCHDCTTIKNEIHGPSLDEVCLLQNAQTEAKNFFVSKTSDHKTIKIDEADETWNIVKTIPFDAVKKYMAIVVEKDGKTYCLIKGADSSIQPMCQGSQSYDSEEFKRLK